MVVTFQLDGREFMALNGGPHFKFTEAFSLLVNCETQDEVDLASAKLQSSLTATTVHGRNGKPVITDGPFAETKEQLGGYHLIRCKDLDEAISIAKRIPTIPFGGTIEVRPLERM